MWKIEIENGKPKAYWTSGKLHCPFCGGEIKPHHVGGVHTPQGFQGKAVDLHVKCKDCGAYFLFGFPITDEQAAKLQSHQGEPVEWWDDDEEIKGRLKTLGYW